MCWGANYNGELGNGQSGANTGGATPVSVAGLDDAVFIDAGSSHTCAIRESGEVVCWGDGGGGRLGSGVAGDSAIPAAVSGLNDAVSIGAGDDHTCAVRATGQVVCWGDGTSGQLGNGVSGANSDNYFPTPVAVDNVDDAVAVSAGDDFTCALRASGAVSCWGDGFNCQLGHGMCEFGAVSSRPVDVIDLDDALSISNSAGGMRSCVVRKDGSAACWGDQHLGNEGGFSSAFPVAVSGLEDVLSVTAGSDRSCAVRQNGTVACWGLGYLGKGDGISSNLPAEVSDLSDAVSIATGLSHTCAVRRTGTVVCWGMEGASLGIGVTGPGGGRSVPTPVMDLTDVVAAP
jgi:alpha-tubulin suppressor-like RCC1 family protein